MEKVSGHRDPLLDSVRIPEGFAYLYSIFFTLFNGEGLTHQEVSAYESLYRVKFTPFELRALFAMDASALRTVMEITKKKES